MWAALPSRLGTDEGNRKKQCLCFLAARRWAALPLHNPPPHDVQPYLRPKEMEAAAHGRKLRNLRAEINLPTTSLSQEFVTKRNMNTLICIGATVVQRNGGNSLDEAIRRMTSAKTFFTSSPSPWITLCPYLRVNDCLHQTSISFPLKYTVFVHWWPNLCSKLVADP